MENFIRAITSQSEHRSHVPNPVFFTNEALGTESHSYKKYHDIGLRSSGVGTQCSLRYPFIYWSPVIAAAVT
jgi:hypothetical protein